MTQLLTKRQFILGLNNCKLNKIMTAERLGEFGARDVFGTTYKNNTSEELLTVLKRLGADVEGYVYNDSMWSKETVTEDSVEAEEVVEEIVEEEEASEETPDTSKIDWTYVEGLENCKESKSELGLYAEGFDIKLSKSKTLANMIKDFKTQKGLI